MKADTRTERLDQSLPRDSSPHAANGVSPEESPQAPVAGAGELSTGFDPGTEYIRARIRGHDTPTHVRGETKNGTSLPDKAVLDAAACQIMDAVTARDFGTQSVS
jgi:hypothetical protein